MVFAETDTVGDSSQCNGMWVHSDLMPLGNGMIPVMLILSWFTIFRLHYPNDNPARLDPASIGSGTEVKRWIAGTIDRDHGERSRYVGMDKIITVIIWSPSHTIVSYDLANPNHFIVAKYHMFAHTLSCPLQDIGRIDDEEPECWLWKVQPAIAKL
ncbi:hypothetical protein B0H14DRAFT_2643030 [Mycena olivaceomarginata]|nr:hypothetical protein B0H14DRAFT_2643030 [Mycena olivaceomarginata]